MPRTIIIPGPLPPDGVPIDASSETEYTVYCAAAANIRWRIYSGKAWVAEGWFDREGVARISLGLLDGVWRRRELVLKLSPEKAKKKTMRKLVETSQ